MSATIFRLTFLIRARGVIVIRQRNFRARTRYRIIVLLSTWVKNRRIAGCKLVIDDCNGFLEIGKGRFGAFSPSLKRISLLGWVGLGLDIGIGRRGYG